MYLAIIVILCLYAVNIKYSSATPPTSRFGHKFILKQLYRI